MTIKSNKPKRRQVAEVWQFRDTDGIVRAVSGDVTSRPTLLNLHGSTSNRKVAYEECIDLIVSGRLKLVSIQASYRKCWMTEYNLETGSVTPIENRDGEYEWVEVKDIDAIFQVDGNSDRFIVMRADGTDGSAYETFYTEYPHDAAEQIIKAYNDAQATRKR